MIRCCEICNKKIQCELHHINSLSLGGNNKKNNKCYLCPNDHTLVHFGEIIIEGKFQTTNGLKLIYRKKNEPSITGLPDPEVFLFKK